VLAAGGYKDEVNRVVLLRLDDQSVESLGEWRLPFGVGYPVETISMIDGRDDELHMVSDRQWLRWRVGIGLVWHDASARRRRIRAWPARGW